jgi:hypothetical protein
MSIVSAYCPVMQSSITRLEDLEGTVTRVFCEEYDAPTRSCRRKQSAASGGPLAQLLARIDEHTLQEHGYRCDLS